MHEKHAPKTGGNQAIHLSNCASVIVPGSGIRLLIPGKAEEQLLNKQLEAPAKVELVRKCALQGIGNREVFTQQSFTIGQSESGCLIAIVISLLVTRQHWRGGWFAALMAPDEQERFQNYLRAARTKLITNLRKERTCRGPAS